MFGILIKTYVITKLKRKEMYVICFLSSAEQSLDNAWKDQTIWIH